MTIEEEVIEKIGSRYPALKDTYRVARERRIFGEISVDVFSDFFLFARNGLGFVSLVCIAGTDENERLAALYSLAADNGVLLNVRLYVPLENPLLPTLTGIYPNADYYERELTDLLGFIVEGLPPGPRYPLPDDWPKGQYPLRKSWRPEMLRDSENTNKPS
jgi:membrane-bound hydrogenase subunit beta